MMKRGHYKGYIFKTILCVLPTFILVFLAYSIISSNASANKTLSLSQEQLILLCNYVYFEDTDQLLPIQDKLNTMKTNGVYNPNLITAPASGIKDSEAIEMFKAIESDKTLSNLVAVDSIDEDIRAVAFVDKSCKNNEDAEAVVVYQGTKGYTEPWLDNLEGIYYTDTDLQKTAGDFFDRVEKNYNISYTTGHSKGGNLAQYVTITRGDNLKQCVSFNGQGFSKLFIDKYSTKLNKNKQKITSICSYKEPVHVMLTPIASNVILIKTDEKITPIASHISSLLYDELFFDKNGNYKPNFFTKPTQTVEIIEDTCNYIINNFNTNSLKTTSELVAPAVSYAMSLMQDSIAHEDMSFIEAFCLEISKKEWEINPKKNNNNNK